MGTMKKSSRKKRGVGGPAIAIDRGKPAYTASTTLPSRTAERGRPEPPKASRTQEETTFGEKFKKERPTRLSTNEGSGRNLKKRGNKRPRAKMAKTYPAKKRETNAYVLGKRTVQSGA